MRDTVVVVISDPSEVQSGAAADIDQGQRPAARRLLHGGERRQQKRTAAHLVGLRDARLEQRNQSGCVRQNEIAEGGIRFGRRPRLVAQTGVERRQLVLGRLRKQEMNGGEEDVRDRRSADVTRDGKQILVQRDLPGQRRV